MQVPFEMVRHLASPPRMQFAEYIMNMRLRCRDTDVQPTGDLLVGQAAFYQFGRLALASGQRWDCNCSGAAGSVIGGLRDTPKQACNDPARAELLAVVDIPQQAHEIAQRRGSRNIPQNSRFRPTYDIVFSLAYGRYDDAQARCNVKC